MPATPVGAESTLTLADGTRLALRSGDEDAARIVAFLAVAACLSPARSPRPGVRRLLAATRVGHNPSFSYETEGGIICAIEPTDTQRPYHRRLDEEGTPVLVFEPCTEEQWFWRQLVRLSACVGRETHTRGGVLLHSGLAVCPGSRSPSATGRTRSEYGVLLAGRSGVGKSTAIRRLPSPWRTLADDVTLVVRDEWGTYWAHPWPTWSRFFGEDAGDGSDTWAVQRAVPLQAIFVLEQGEENRVEPMGPGHAVCLLAELARQTSMYVLEGMPPDEIVAFNLKCFENLCDLVQAVPAYLLDVSLNGAFWEEIERVMP